MAILIMLLWQVDIVVTTTTTTATATNTATYISVITNIYKSIMTSIGRLKMYMSI